MSAQDPAFGLPPTLTPNAVLAMAPPAPRALSLLGACLVYTVCGAALVLAPVPRTSPSGPTTKPEFFSEPSTPGVVPCVVQLKPPTPLPGQVAEHAPRRPEGWTPPVDSDVVPTTATTLPTRDGSRDSLRAPTPEDALRPTTSAPRGTLGTIAPPAAMVEFDFQQMRVLQAVNPVYPPMARLARIQGEVVLLMAVDPRGVPTEVRALSGPHPSLEQEAMRVARLWRFEPATLNGQPVSAQFRLTIQFRLK